MQEVGQEVVSHCSKCKGAGPHIIVTIKKNASVGKVQCKGCEHTHMFKDPAAVQAKASKKSTPRKKALPAASSELWQKTVGQGAEVASQKYSFQTKYGQGDVIDHPKFGPGVVEKLIDADKIQIVFQDEVKTLIHNR